MSRTLFALCLAILSACTTTPEHEAPVCGTPGDASADSDITVTSRDALVEAGGTDFAAWTFDGDVPGPVWRIPLGETRRIKLVNQSPRPVSLHFHGLAYAASDDGSPEQPTSMVAPGCAHVYTVRAVAPGVWPYHSHRESRTELAFGLYGAVIVPSPGEPAADHEFVALLGQLGLEGAAGGEGEEGEGHAHKPAVHADDDEGGGGGASFFMTINGRPGEDARVIELQGGQYVASTAEGAMATARVGERVRWRVANVSPDDPHTFHIHGHRWCDTGVPDAQGACLGNRPVIDNPAVLPSQGITLEYVEDAPGTWMYHCHVIDHVNDGMYAFYKVEP